MKQIKRVVIPIDKSDASKIAVKQGSMLAKLLGVNVSLIFIDDSHQFIASAALEDKLRKEHMSSIDEFKKTVELNDVDVKTEVIVGDSPADEIIKYAMDDDLIVMASHSKKGMERFILGSVSEEVLNRINCHVMILKPKLNES